MYEITFYQDSAGKQPVKEHLLALSKRTDIKHLDGDIWELRPLRNRVLFFGHNGNEFVLLHHFIKKTQKTPQTEIDQAKRNMKDFIERSGKNE